MASRPQRTIHQGTAPAAIGPAAPVEGPAVKGAWSGLTVARFSQLFRSVLEDRLRPVGLTAAQYLALGLVDHSPGLSNAELARELFVTPQTTIRVVQALTDEGLVSRTPNARHGRLLETYLTPKGSRVLAGATPLADAAETEVLAALTPGQRDRLLRSLQRCTAGLHR
ncbi:MAG: MarR family winged helix-turn-helix transcriptional regulator [Actinomycetota bacterium]